MPTLTRVALGLPPSAAPRRPMSELGGATVHHTDGATLKQQRDQTLRDVALWVRNLWAFHTDERLPEHQGLPAVTPWADARGWADIGYHVLVHVPTRAVIDGRPYDRAGAHAPGANRIRLGVAVLGGDPKLTDDQVRWLSARLNSYRSLARNGSGWIIDGHRDWRNTGCPGDALYRRLPALAAPGRVLPPIDPEPTVPDDLEATMHADQLDQLQRLAIANLTVQLDAYRRRIGANRDPESDAIQAERIASGRIDVHETLHRLDTEKAGTA